MDRVTPMVKGRILFVDDDPSVLRALVRRFRSLRDWEVATAPSGPAALALLDDQAFDVVVTDMQMPGMDGLSLLGRVRALQPYALRIILSGQMKLVNGQAVDVADHLLEKPCNTSELLSLIAHRRDGAPRVEAS